MAKGFDFKQFMLEKGERVGFGVALLVMIVLIGLGTAQGFSNDSPGTTAEWIKARAGEIEGRINTGSTEGLIPPLEPIFKKGINFDPVRPEAYASAAPNFFATPLEVTKSLNPVVMPPDDANAVLVRVAVKSMMVSPQKDRVQIGVLVPLDKPKGGAPVDPRQKAYMDWLAARAQMMAGMGMRPPAGVPLPGAPGMGGDAGSTEYKLEWVDVTKIPAGAEPAEEVKPVRMAIVTAAFPYKAQLIQYCNALRPGGAHIAKAEDLAKHPDLLPRFLPVAVRRRTIDTASGKVKEEWRDLDYIADFKPLLATAVGTEPESPDIKPLIFPGGLVMPRPVLARGSYPEPQLGQITKAARVLQQSAAKGEQTILTPLERKLQGDGLEIFEAVTRPDEDRRKMPERKPGEGKEAAAPVIPDHCLIRFIDVTVKPGFTYEYQMQVRQSNPNFGKKTEVAYLPLAEKKDLESAWWPGATDKQIKLPVPRELHVYGTEIDDRTLKAKTSLDPKLLGDKDVAWMQVHRWLETTNLNPEQRGSQVAVGDWSVGDVPVRRGEYIGRPENVKVAMWFPQKRAFDIAVPIQAVTKPGIIGVRPQVIKGIPVNFTTDDLLVDWDGGKISQTFRTADGKLSRDVREDANVEYLIMAPDGKLTVRQSRTDKNNPERADRYNDWDNWIKTVEAGGGKPGKDGPRPPVKDPFGKK